MLMADEICYKYKIDVEFVVLVCSLSCLLTLMDYVSTHPDKSLLLQKKHDWLCKAISYKLLLDDQVLCTPHSFSLL